MERKILQEVDNKIISLKYRIKFHKTNPGSKRDAVIEYLIPINKAANNIAFFIKSTMSLLWNFKRWR